MKRPLYSGVIPGLVARNRYEVDGDTVRIYLNARNGNADRIALIDVKDAHQILGSESKWVCDVNGYAKISTKDSRTVYMHRVITEAPRGIFVDHANRDSLDNRRANLRLVTNAQNLQNSSKSNASSGFKNVHWHPQQEKWMVRICINRRQIIVGLYADVNVAAQVASEARRIHHPFSPENSPQEVA